MTSAFSISLAPPVNSRAPESRHAAGPSRPGFAGHGTAEQAAALRILAEPEPEPGCRWCAWLSPEEEYPGGGRDRGGTSKVEADILAKFEARRLAREQEAARQARLARKAEG